MRHTCGNHAAIQLLSAVHNVPILSVIAPVLWTIDAILYVCQVDTTMQIIMLTYTNSHMSVV